MQKWEYATIVYSQVGDEISRTPSTNINPPEGNLFEILTHLGEEGWELATTTSHTVTGDDGSVLIMDNYVLKRPKA